MNIFELILWIIAALSMIVSPICMIFLLIKEKKLREQRRIERERLINSIYEFAYQARNISNNKTDKVNWKEEGF